MLCIVLFSVISIEQVHATVYSDRLPGGKNYLDVENYTNFRDELNQIDPIYVLPDTDYVISVPSEEYMPNMEIYISGEVAYVNGLARDLSNCVLETDRTYCTFHTTSTETFITVDFVAYYMDYHFQTYGLDDFQLEEGTYPTSYDEYIIPPEDTEPVISGDSAYITSYSTNESLNTIVSTHFTASDDIDGDLTDSIVVVYDEYTGNEQTIGSYAVTLEVSDTSNNTTQYHFSILVKDTIVPVITGPSNVSINVDNPPTVDQILQDNFTFSDGYDGILTPTVVTDNYTANKLILGTYQVIFEIMDSSHNVTSQTLNLSVEDVTAPMLNQSSNITVFISNPLTSEQIINGLTWSDNYDNESSLTVTEGTNTYTGNEMIPGTYSIDVVASDQSGNTVSETLQVTVLDDINPTFTGPTELTVSYTKQLLHSDILSQLTVTDTGSTMTINDASIVNDTYSANFNTVGTYIMTLKASDISGNVATHDIAITVIDDIPPVIYADEFLVTVTTDTIFDKNDMLLLMIQNDEITEQSYDIDEVINEYKGNETVPGSYRYIAVLKGEDGQSYQKEIMINVVSNQPLIDADLIWRNIILYGLSSTLVMITLWVTKKQ